MRSYGLHLRLLLPATLAFACGEPDSSSGERSIAAGGHVSCVVDDGAAVKCWGRNDGAAPGMRSDEEMLGDDELPSSYAGFRFDSPVRQLAPGSLRSCAVLETGKVWCWGHEPGRSFGHPDWDGSLGDDEFPTEASALDLGALPPVVGAGVGNGFRCFLHDDAKVRCFGSNFYGQIGLGDQHAFGERFGDDASEPLAEMPVLDLGGDVETLVAGGPGACAVLKGGALRCWGQASFGRLGLGSLAFGDALGDDEAVVSAEPVRTGAGPVTDVATSTRHTCALHADGSIVCWGETGPWLGAEVTFGDPRFGLGVGDTEHPDVLEPIRIDGGFADVCVGIDHTCALSNAGAVRCWGVSLEGQLGLGNTEFLGDDESVADIPDVPLGERVTQMECGYASTCVLLESSDVRCWGRNSFGALGRAWPIDRHLGDDEAVLSVGPVQWK